MRLDFSPRSVGSNISFLSAILSTNIPCVIRTVDHDNVGRKDCPPAQIKNLIELFNIDQSLLSFEIVNSLENDLFDQVHDLTKVFSPYISTDLINVFGQTYKTGCRSIKFGQRKPCIALGCFSSKRNFEILTDSGADETYNQFPKVRHYTTETNSKIFDFLLKCGYDVINLDSFQVSLEHKIFMLNELCDAVVTYEGGLAHIAHVLKIPTIILPWRNHTNNLQQHLLHLDSKTYFAKSIEEVLSWTRNDLYNLIDGLVDDQTNNIFFNNPVRWSRDLEFVEVQSNNNLQRFFLKFTNFEKEFILDYVLTTRHEFLGNPIQYIDQGSNLSTRAN